MIISATGAPSTLLSAKTLRAARRRRGDQPQLLLDLAVPADIEAAAGELPGVELRSADDLGRLARANMRSREAAAREAEAMLDRGVQSYAEWLGARSVMPTIRTLRQDSEAHRRVALERAQRRLASGMPAEDVLEYLSRYLTNRMLHAPMAALHDATGHEAQQTAIAAARQIFGLTEDAGAEVDDRHPA